MRTRIVALALALAAVARAGAEPLPRVPLDLAHTTASGLSSGGYLAVQLHLAWSSVFRRGVGVVAAGPWYCAEGTLANATGRCLRRDTPIPVPALQATASRWAQQGLIDPLANLQRSQVVLFSGTRDTAVRQAVTDDLHRFYEAFVPQAQIRYLNQLPAEHGMVTDDYGNPCDRRALPYVQNCGFDLAGTMLQTLVGPLAPRNDAGSAGRWVAFNQLRYAGEDDGFGSRGFVYLPPGCDGTATAPCRLHVVLHGCSQNVTDIGDIYLRHTGYTRWADTNRLVLLFPQTGPRVVNGCWDWWGYTGADYAQRSAPQMAAIVAMVQAIAGQPPVCHEARAGQHVWAGRATVGPWGLVRAAGSRRIIGWPWQTVTLREAPRGHFRPGRCA